MSFLKDYKFSTLSFYGRKQNFMAILGTSGNKFYAIVVIT